MNTRFFQFAVRPAICTTIALAGVISSSGQTLINLGTQGRNADFTGQPYTRPIKTGTALPATCTIGDMYLNVTAPAGKNLYACTATNTWTLQNSSSGSGSGLADPGSNGVVVRTALNVTTAVPAPAGTIVGTTDTQTLTNKSIAASEINSGTLSSSVLPLINLASGVTGNLAIANLNGGTGASSTTFWRGDGTWATPAGGGNVATSANMTAGNVPTATGATTLADGGQPYPGSAFVGVSDVQTLTNKSIDAFEINSGTLSSSVLPLISLATGVTGNLAVANLNGGTGASNTTFWRGDGTWATPAGGGNVATSANMTAGNVPTATGATTLADGGQPYPGSAFVGVSDTQTLTNKSIDASEIKTGTLASSRIPAVNLASAVNGGVAGNLPVANLNGGTGASSTTFWRGDGTWATPAGGGNVATSANMTAGNVPKATGATTLADGGQPYPTSAFVGVSDTQTLTNKSISASQINSGVLAAAQMPALSGDVTTQSGSTATTLATVNANPGTYGDASHSVQLTVDAKGRITAIAQVSISGGSGGSGSGGISSGLLAALPATCASGTLYFATDQPAGQQIYSCSSTNTWTQIVSLGGSGALAFTNGSLDIVTAVVPRLMAANSFTGSNAFAGRTTFNSIATGVATNTDMAGQLTLSSGTATYSFTGTYTSAPICTASDTTGVNAVQVTTTATSLTVKGTGADVINYICVGRN